MDLRKLIFWYKVLVMQLTYKQYRWYYGYYCELLLQTYNTLKELNVSNNNNITDEKSIGEEFKTNDTLKY
jgi:hypothetical protein